MPDAEEKGMTELTGMTPQELSDWCKAQGMPAFRGKQIFRWIHQGADFDAMTNLLWRSRSASLTSGKARLTIR